MERKVVSGIMLTLLLIGMLMSASNIQLAKSEPTTIIVPDDYKRIQWAIGNASNGDTILVKAGTYYEHVNVTKTLSLIGEDRVTTIVDGGGTWTVIKVTADNVNVTGFTIQNGGEAPYSGIFVGNCSGGTISNNLMRNSAYGIEIFKSNGSSITGNTIMNNSWAGIYIHDSNENIIHDNTITNNSIGAWISSSTVPNTFYHNNFINNTNQASDFGSSKWDNGAEGNYWSDYNGTDLDGDGIGDTLLPHQGVDYYPLISRYMEGDVNHDAIVNIVDGVILGVAFGTKPNDPKWNPHADLNDDKIINIIDIVMWVIHFGETW